MSIDPYKEEREEQNNNSFTPDNNNNVNHGVLSPEQKEKNKQDQKNRRGEQERKEQRMAGSEEFQNKISGRGLDDATLNGAYTKRELRAEMQAGNFTKQECIKNHNYKTNGRYSGADKIEKLGFFIGLPTKKIKPATLKKLCEHLLNISNL